MSTEQDNPDSERRARVRYMLERASADSRSGIVEALIRSSNGHIPNQPIPGDHPAGDIPGYIKIPEKDLLMPDGVLTERRHFAQTHKKVIVIMGTIAGMVTLGIGSAWMFHRITSKHPEKDITAS